MSDDDDDDNPSATENENDFNQSDPLNEPIIDPRGLRKPGQAPVYRHGVIVKISAEGISSFLNKGLLSNPFTGNDCNPPTFLCVRLKDLIGTPLWVDQGGRSLPKNLKYSFLPIIKKSRS